LEKAWDSDGNNKAPKAGANVTVAQGDSRYVQALAGKAYIARRSTGPDSPKMLLMVY
jgi:hypothetical protein